MRLDRFIAGLDEGAATLFSSEYTYPAPFDTLGVMIAKKATRDFGGLKVLKHVENINNTDLQELIYEELTLSDYQIKALNKMIAALEVNSNTPDKREVHTYGEDIVTDDIGQSIVTSNIGARSSTDTLGATDGTTINTDTSYETVTGKQTTTARTQTEQVTNGSSSTAAVDSTVSAAHTDIKTRDERTDTIEHFNNIGEGDAADYIAKWLAIKDAPIMVTFEKIIVDALTMPYYEEG